MNIFGCHLVHLDHNKCINILDWIHGNRAKPSECAGEVEWLLAYCVDGIVWGRYEGDAWRLASKAFPDFCGELVLGKLQELRLFGRDSETMIWRAGGKLVGRVASDNDEECKDYERPLDETRVLVGDRLCDSKDGFSFIKNAAGSRQVVPLVLGDTDLRKEPVELKIRHYLSQDEATGAMLVTLSRLVALTR